MKAIVPDWAKDAVWYQIFPERFANGCAASNPGPASLERPAPAGWTVTPWTSDWYSRAQWEERSGEEFYKTVLLRRYGGDMKGIIDRLGYIKELGATALYLNPMFRAASHHKYDGMSFHHIDEHFGPDPEGDRRLLASAKETADPPTWVWTSADKMFLELVAKAHAMGLRVIIDGVFNHCGRGFFAFQDLLKNKKSSPYLDWYKVLEWTPNAPDGFYYSGWWGINDLPEFRREGDNFAPGYKQYLFDITTRWLAPEGKADAGCDGFRLDVAFLMPHGFWKDWRRHVKAVKPDAYLTAEVIDLEPSYLQGDEFDAMMNYQFWQAVHKFMSGGKRDMSAAELDRNLAKVREAYPEDVTYVMQNLLSSHDTPRLRSILANPGMDMSDFQRFNDGSKTEINKAYDTSRGGKTEDRLHRLCAALQMAYIGAPMIYYGDEVGMTGANDPDCRKPMLWPEMNFEDESLPPGRPASQFPNKADTSLLDWYRKLTALRNGSKALRRGTFKTLYAGTNDRLFVFLREHDGESVLCAFNAGEGEASALLPDCAAFCKTVDAVGSTALIQEKGTVRMSIPSLTAAMFFLQRRQTC